MKIYCYLLGIFCLAVLPSCRQTAPVSQQQNQLQESTNAKPPTQTQPKVLSEEDELKALTADGDSLSRVPKVKVTRKQDSAAETVGSETNQPEDEVAAELNNLVASSSKNTASEQGVNKPEPQPGKEVEGNASPDVPPKAADIPKFMGAGGLPDLDLSPAAVAEYLIITADFKGFDMAVTDLIKTGVMTSEEAVQYKNRVGLELESLLQEAENELLEDKEDDGLETPVAPWTNYNWPVYDSPLDELSGFEAPRQRRTMADDSRDQIVLAQLIDRVVSEYARLRDRAAYEQRRSDEDEKAQALLDMLLAKQRAAEVMPSSYLPLADPYKSELPAWMIDSASQQNKDLPKLPPQQIVGFESVGPQQNQESKVEQLQQTTSKPEAATVAPVPAKNNAKSEEKTH